MVRLEAVSFVKHRPRQTDLPRLGISFDWLGHFVRSRFLGALSVILEYLGHYEKFGGVPNIPAPRGFTVQRRG